jgi:penicillin-insensitive murein endopeptidase
MIVLRALVIAAAVALSTGPSVADSVCYGTTAKGRLEGGCQLPASGANYAPYSAEGVRAGRTYLHCSVGAIVTSAYADLGNQLPSMRFVYGETGKARGGDFSPHKSHQNGLSVDFFVPVRDSTGQPARLPTGAENRWGYDLDFDSQGRHGKLTIDFQAIALHLLAIAKAAKVQGVGIRKVYFDTALQRQLHKTSAWPQIKNLPFSTAQGWWRHDEHYHVDFSIPCRPL